MASFCRLCLYHYGLSLNFLTMSFKKIKYVLMFTVSKKIYFSKFVSMLFLVFSDSFSRSLFFLHFETTASPFQMKNKNKKMLTYSSYFSNSNNIFGFKIYYYFKKLFSGKTFTDSADFFSPQFF